MAFKRVSSTKKSYASPLELFPDIRPRRIAAPYDHQAQLLRDYAQKGTKAEDVAIQGATGSGKTLVGLLIAEWRRRQLRERVVYLCPTRQLVNQVAGFAKEQMGLPAYPFIGSRAEFPPTEQAGWRDGNLIAITTYSALFNINPFFSSPNFLVLDDAHAADQYIGEYWTVRVERHEHQDLFMELAAVLGDTLHEDEYSRLISAPRTPSDYYWSQIVPAPLAWKKESSISAILDQAPDRSDLAYRWSVLKGHLRACQIFVSPYEILIRPVLPLTAGYSSFTGAKQRLYMSATLGRGGELERLAGRKSILRLQSPSGWNGNGVGRRFFLFPEASLNADHSAEFVASLISICGRALHLVTDDKGAREARAFLQAKLPGHRIFNAREIEVSKVPFTSEEHAVALIANRYDGIDFPNDECRLLIVKGRPAGGHLYERFLADKMGARALFAERIRTRVVQAFGRCTRSANDYAIVLSLGNQLLDELLLRENLTLLDPELQAEITFGHEQSKSATAEELRNLARSFLKQGDEWREAEPDIASLRDQMTETLPPSLDALERAAPHEIDYTVRIWNGDYSGALDAAQRTLSELSGGEELKGYRAWWQYLAGCAAALDAEVRNAVRDKADQHFRLARDVGGVRWLGRLSHAASPTPGSLSSPEDEVTIESIETGLCELGLLAERRFTETTTTIRRGLAQREAKKFERSQKELGDLLGFQTGISDAQGAPDPWWIAGDRLCIVFEDHLKEKDGAALSVEKARQVASHPKWIVEKVRGLAPSARIIPVLITNADSSSEECRIQLKSVAVWHVTSFRAWADSVLAELRKVRSTLSRAGDLSWRADALKALSSVSATPSALVELLDSLLRK
jgi:hypothetical protein